MSFQESGDERFLQHAALGLFAVLSELRNQSAPNKTSEVVDPTDPFFRLCYRYLPPDTRRKGNSRDDSGAFFLLALTEHLREQNKNPHHALAYKLLGAVRQVYNLDIKNIRSPENIEQTTATRIANLKKKYPDWADDLGALKNHFKSHRAHIAQVVDKDIKSNRNRDLI